MVSAPYLCFPRIFVRSSTSHGRTLFTSARLWAYSLVNSFAAANNPFLLHACLTHSSLYLALCAHPSLGIVPFCSSRPRFFSKLVKGSHCHVRKHWIRPLFDLRLLIVLTILKLLKIVQGDFCPAHVLSVNLRDRHTHTDCEHRQFILPVHHFNDLLLRQYGFYAHVHPIADNIVAVHGNSCSCVVQRSEPCLAFTCSDNLLLSEVSRFHRTHWVTSDCLDLPVYGTCFFQDHFTSSNVQETIKARVSTQRRRHQTKPLHAHMIITTRVEYNQVMQRDVSVPLRCDGTSRDGSSPCARGPRHPQI